MSAPDHILVRTECSTCPGFWATEIRYVSLLDQVTVSVEHRAAYRQQALSMDVMRQTNGDVVAMAIRACVSELGAYVGCLEFAAPAPIPAHSHTVSWTVPLDYSA